MEQVDRAMQNFSEAAEHGVAVKDFMATFDPDYRDILEDAAGELDAFVASAESALFAFKQRVGTSPAKPDPVIGWAQQVWLLYRRVDKKPTIGRRGSGECDEAGHFERLLREAAKPLNITFAWHSIHTAISTFKKQLGT